MILLYISSQPDATERIEHEGMDANTDSVCMGMEMKSHTKLAIFITPKTGTSSTFVVTVQIYDGNKWWDTDHTQQGEGTIHDLDCICEMARIKVTTPEGSAATFDVVMMAK